MEFVAAPAIHCLSRVQMKSDLQGPAGTCITHEIDSLPTHAQFQSVHYAKLGSTIRSTGLCSAWAVRWIVVYDITYIVLSTAILLFVQNLHRLGEEGKSIFSSMQMMLQYPTPSWWFLYMRPWSNQKTRVPSTCLRLYSYVSVS